MPVTEQVAKRLVRDLMCLRFSPDEADSNGLRKQVGETILKVAKSDAHAEQIVSYIIRTQPTFPTPVDIWNAAEAETPPELKISGGCDRCRNYDGYVYVPDKPNTVRRCDCWRRS